MNDAGSKGLHLVNNTAEEIVYVGRPVNDVPTVHVPPGLQQVDEDRLLGHKVLGSQMSTTTCQVEKT